MKSRKRKYIHLKLLELSSPALKTFKNSGLTCISETRIKRYMKKDNFIIKKCRRSISPCMEREVLFCEGKCDLPKKIIIAIAGGYGVRLQLDIVGPNTLAYKNRLLKVSDCIW